MKDIAEKLRTIEIDVASEKGKFRLFALFLREDAPSVWDLLVSANWIDKDKQSALRFITKKVASALSTPELVAISRIVIIEKNDPALAALTSAFSIEHQMTDLLNCNFSGLQIKHAIIITSNSSEV